MRLLFKQRMLSWMDSYDIYAEDGSVLYTVRSKLAWGHCLKIFDAQDREVGVVKERVITLLPQFEMYLGERYLGCIRRELSFFRPRYSIDCNGWQVEGNFLAWDYTIRDAGGQHIASITKELMHFTDVYAIDVDNPADALCVLMLVLAIDAEKCSSGKD